VAISCATAADLNACGDKFLRIGRSPRTNSYAAVHRAAILLYAPAAKPADIKEYETFLKRAGHRPVVIHDTAALSASLAEARYDLVITPLPRADDVRSLAESIKSTANLLPIVPKVSKVQLSEIERRYEHVLRADDTRADALAEIDRVMEIRLGSRP
jgi:hypothetical protein